jgi:hypothetical protein
MGYPIFINPSRVFALSELASNIDSYRSAWKDAGHEGDGNVGLRIPVYVAETAQQAYDEPRESTVASMQGPALGSPAALTVRARPATGGRRRIGSAV